MGKIGHAKDEWLDSCRDVRPGVVNPGALRGTVVIEATKRGGEVH